MGRDLLAQDYLLKQITASLIYPEDELGKKFWTRIYEEAQKKYGNTNIPVNTFNKVWIVPEKAIVYENAQAGTAYVVESRLKVMLEEDYLATTKNQSQPKVRQPGDMFQKEHQNVSSSTLPSDSPSTMKTPQGNPQSPNEFTSQIIREIIIPELTKEINEGKNFAQLRQVYNSLILATWYKKKIKDSILSQVYADKKKVAGINIDDPKEKDQIYQQYLQAFKKGVYSYIKEDIDSSTLETATRKYFSGGAEFTDLAMSSALSLTTNTAFITQLVSDQMQIVGIKLDQAMNAETLTLILKQKGISNPQVDEHFLFIFNTLQSINPNVDPQALFDLYVKTVQGNIEKFKHPTGKVLISEWNTEEHNRYGGENYERIVKESHFLTFLKEKIGIPDVYILEKYYTGEYTGRTDGVSDESHYYNQYHENYYVAPKRFDSLLRFAIRANEKKLREIVSGKKEDDPKTPTHIDAKRIEQMLILKGVTESKIYKYLDTHFVTILNSILNVNPDVDIANLFSFYISSSRYWHGNHSEEFNNPTGVVWVENNKDEFTVGQLEKLNLAALEKFNKLKAGNDKKVAFIANLEKHFLHELLIQRQEQDKENNKAMATRKQDKLGGIDLTPNNILQTQNAGKVIKFHHDIIQLQQLQNAPGFTPVIINIQPMINLHEFLGVSVQESMVVGA